MQKIGDYLLWSSGPIRSSEQELWIAVLKQAFHDAKRYDSLASQKEFHEWYSELGNVGSEDTDEHGQAKRLANLRVPLSTEVFISSIEHRQET